MLHHYLIIMVYRVVSTCTWQQHISIKVTRAPTLIRWYSYSPTMIHLSLPHHACGNHNAQRLSFYSSLLSISIIFYELDAWHDDGSHEDCPEANINGETRRSRLCWQAERAQSVRYKYIWLARLRRLTFAWFSKLLRPFSFLLSQSHSHTQAESSKPPTKKAIPDKY